MVLLRLPEDLQVFCNTLGIPVIDIPNLYAECMMNPTHVLYVRFGVKYAALQRCMLGFLTLKIAADPITPFPSLVFKQILSY